MLFRKMCLVAETMMELKAEPLLEDVDGSKYQTYHHKAGTFTVCNSFYFNNEVRIDSDFELETYLGDKWFIRRIDF